jgi:hypothetical protein
MMHECERDDLVASLKQKMLDDPGKLWDEHVNADGLGLIGVDVACIAFPAEGTRARIAYKLLRLIESRLEAEAQRLAEEEADVVLSKPRTRGQRMPMGAKEREDADDLS